MASARRTLGPTPERWSAGMRCLLSSTPCVMGRTELRAYASSVMWADDASVEREVQLVLEAGYKEVKIKIGQPVEDAIKRAHFVRQLMGDEIKLYADANWA